MSLNIQPIPYPELTAANRDLLIDVIKGYKIYNTDIGDFEMYDGTTWQLLSGSNLIEWSLYFTSTYTQLEILHDVATIIDSASLGTKVASIEYSIDNGDTWDTPSYPIEVLGDTYTRWRILTFNSTYTEGTIIIKGTKG